MLADAGKSGDTDVTPFHLPADRRKDFIQRSSKQPIILVAPNNKFVSVSIVWYLTGNAEKSKSFLDTLPSGTDRKDSKSPFPTFPYENKVLVLDQVVIDEDPYIAVLRPGPRPFEYEAYQNQTFNRLIGLATLPTCVKDPPTPPAKTVLSTEEVEHSYKVEILKRPTDAKSRTQHRPDDIPASFPKEPPAADYTAALDPRICKLRTAREEEETLKRWKQRLSRYQAAKRKIMKTPPEQLLRENQESRRRQRLGLPTNTDGHDTVLKSETADGSNADTADDQTSKET
ncbi:hypothetical protein HDU96_004330, partial [Phlyctochytrium bullatum]